MGVPGWIAQDPEREWEPDEVVDNVVATVERHRREMEKNDGGVPPGLQIVVKEKRSKPSLG